MPSPAVLPVPLRGASGRAVLAMGVIAGLWFLSLAFAWAHLTMNVRDQRVNVRFVDGITAGERRRVESLLGLQEASWIEGNTWNYLLADQSRRAVERLVHDPLVADTFHIDRTAYRVTLDRPDVPRWERYVVEVLPARVMALALAAAALLLSVVGRRLAAPVVSSLLDRWGLRAPGVWVLTAAFVCLLSAFGLFVDNGLQGDEDVHFDQVSRFARGDWKIEPALTMLPGFHALVAAAAWITDGTRVESIRLFVFGLGLCAIAAFFALARAENRGDPTAKTMQFVFLPILFPQLLLIYTDVASLLFVLLMLLAARRQRYRAAGLFALAACLVRQSNAVWVAFVCLRSYLDDNGWKWAPLTSAPRRYWPFVPGIVAVIALVVLNQGQIALGDVQAHPLGLPHLGNLFFLLFLSCFLFMGLWWAYRRETWARLRHPGTWMILAAAFVVFWFGFSADHPYNTDTTFLRNRILSWSTAGWSNKALFCVPVAVTLASIPSIRLREHGWLLYVATVLSLLPPWLVEQRYYLIPLAMFLAERSTTDPRAEWAQVMISVSGSVVLFTLVERGVAML